MKQSYTFYGTFGHGQPNFPGYYEIEVFAETEQEAEEFARKRMKDATNNRYCSFHNSLDKVHPDDKIFRGRA